MHKLPKTIHALMLGAAITTSGAAFGQGADSIIDLLLRKGIINDREAKELKGEVDADLARAMNRANKTKVASWLDEMKWSGDLRLRAEFFDNEDQSSPNDRWRYRYRARLGLETKFKDWATAGLQVATGGDDPVSSNQSFQDTFSRKSIGLDLGYVTLTPPGQDWISATGGKMKNPIWQTGLASPLQYDGDVNPEGIAERLAWSFGEEKRWRLFGNFGQFILDELSGDANDPFLLEFQGGIQASLGGQDPKKPVVKATLAAGYLLTQNVDQMGPVGANQPTGAAAPAAQSSSPNRGNATRQPGGAGTTLFYLDEFQVLTLRGEIEWKLRDKPFWRTPCQLTFSGEYLKNMADRYDNLTGAAAGLINPDQTEGYGAQLKFGSAKKQNEWEVAYLYKVLEADATWDVLTDSDWGLGGTDRRGHVFKGAYNVREWWQLGFTAFVTEKISNRPNNTNNTRGTGTEDLLRVQMDTVFKF
jgi:hypothetical protein